MKKAVRLFSLLLVLILMIFTFSGCGTANAVDLMKGVKVYSVEVSEIDDEFKNSYLSFSVDAFKAVAKDSKQQNVVFSPMSLQNVLAMLMNGAEGDTLTEMESVLGMSRDEMNRYMYSFMSIQNADCFKSANSLWFRNDGKSFKPNKDFLQVNADYYGAELFASEFSSKTVKDVNKWVSDKTDGMIDDIIDDLDEYDLMLIINAILFDAEWSEKYTDNQIRPMDFTSAGGEKKEVEGLYSTEPYYIKDKNAVGVRKPYKGGYSFAALLPNENIDIYDYINSLTAESLAETISNTYKTDVITRIPKFYVNYESSYNKILSDMGMPTAFGYSADFSSLGDSDLGNIYLEKVAQTACIKLDENGTRAAAVTHADLAVAGGHFTSPPKVYLERPFVYMILDNRTNLPIFIGVITNL